MAELKRCRRVSMACDHCRTKKIKCDGKAPCNKCTTANLFCKTGNRRKFRNDTYPDGYVDVLLQQKSLLVRGIRELRKQINAWNGSEGNLSTCHINEQPQIQNLHESFGMCSKEEGFQDIIFSDDAYCDTYAQVEQLGVEVSANSKHLPPVSTGNRRAISGQIHPSSVQSSSAYAQTEPCSASETNESFSTNGYTLDEGQSDTYFQAWGTEPDIYADPCQLFLSSNCSRLASDRPDQEVELDALKRLYFPELLLEDDCTLIYA